MHRTVHHFTLLGILVLFQLCQSNEYYPKRFLINNSEIHDESITNENILDTKYSNPIDQCPIQCFIDNDSGDMVNCSISQEISVTSSKKSLIRCERNIETGELILGHKESVRGITPGALGHLLEATSISNQPLSRSGQLEFHINLNMVRLDAKCFQDLGGLITDIRLLNTVYMHPDSLIDLQHLRSFEIESGQTPLYLSDDDDHGVNDNSKNDTYMMEVDDLVKPDSIKKPAFIRLHPLDNTVPISFNLNTKCHQCDLQSDSSDVDGNSSSSRSGSSSSSSSSSSGSKSLRSIQKTDNLIIIVFTSKRDLPSTGQQISPKLSMIFPYTCPVIIDGIGCPKQSDLITMNHEGSSDLNKGVINQSPSESSFNIPVIEQLKTITFIQSESKHTLSLSIILIIWCTIITVSFIIIVLIIFCCIRKRFTSLALTNKSTTSITPLRLFHVCEQPNSSVEDEDEEEEVSSNSTSSGFYSHQKTSLSKEKTELLSSTITNITDTTTTTTTAAAMVKTPTTNNNHHRRNDAHSSCNSLRTTTNPSITNGVAASRYSIISLKDQRSINSNKYNTFYSIIHSNKPNNYHPHNRNHYPCRKSYMSKRRSIGSQTDFTDIESDNPESYSTLDRYFMQKYKRYPYSIDSNNDNNYNKNSNIRNNSSDYYLFNRTTSTQILPYFRNNLNQMDGILITKSNLYSNHLLSHSNITMNNTNILNNNIHDYHDNINDKNNSDLLILMIDGKPKSVCNIPPNSQNGMLSTPVN